MTDPREFNRLADELDAYAQKYSGDWAKACLTVTWCDMKAIVTALRTAAAASSAGALNGEPVAWQYRDDRWADDRWHVCAEKPSEFPGRRVRPLYAALIPEPAKAGDAVLLREALVTCRDFIRGEQIENAVVCIGSMQSLGDMIDEALSSTAQPDTAAQGGNGGVALQRVAYHPIAPAAPVSVDEVAAWLNTNGGLIARAALSPPGILGCTPLARALLDAFKMERK